MKSYRLLALLAVAALLLAVALAPTSIAQRPGDLRIQDSRIQTIRIPNQQVDYAKREISAPAQIKTRLATLRQQLQARGRRFSVGYTTALDIPLEVLSATRIPRNLPTVTERVNTRATQLQRVDRTALSEAARINPDILKFALRCNAKGKSWDWRRNGKVTPVKAQICGTCWDFTSMGAFEGSYAIRNNALVDASEQYILNCASAGTCAGGWWMPVFDFMLANGTATETDVPFTGNDSASCPTGTTLPYRVSAWAFVGSDYSKVAPTDAMKQALCEHGPLAVAVQTDTAFQAYTGGASGDEVFDETDQSFPWIDHGVTLIGWDDAKGAWLIKNSWGTGWGSTCGFGSERGYMWIAYGSNNIGIAAAWVDAQSRFFRLPTDWLRILEKENIRVRPLPEPDPGPIRITTPVIRP